MRDCIVARLAYFMGNKTRTAESLGITPKTLYVRLNKYGIRAPDFRKQNVVKQRVSYADKLARKKSLVAEARVCAKARKRRQVSRAVRDLIDAPLVTVVPMGAKDRRVMVKARTAKVRRLPLYQPMARWPEMRL